MTPLLSTIARIKGADLAASETNAVTQAVVACGFEPLFARSLDPALFAMARAHLEQEEGRVAHAYRDHLGYLTLGVGRLVDKRRGGRLLDSEIDLLLVNDLVSCSRAMRLWPAWMRVQDHPVRATVLLSMCFQLGPTGLSRFTTTLAHVSAGRFEAAAEAMLKSLWASQTPARAGRVAHMMRTGERA